MTNMQIDQIGKQMKEDIQIPLPLQENPLAWYIYVYLPVMFGDMLQFLMHVLLKCAIQVIQGAYATRWGSPSHHGGSTHYVMVYQE